MGAQLRKEAGKYIAELRAKANLTQHEVAKAVGLDYYTGVSQIERGANRVPPDKQTIWAKALGVNEVVFARRLLSYYDPHTWEILYGPNSRDE